MNSSIESVKTESMMKNMMDSISDNRIGTGLSINLRTHYILAVLYLFLLALVMMIVCYLTYRYQVRRRSRRASYQRIGDDDKPPTYQMVYFSESPPKYGSLVSRPPPDYGTIAKI